MAALDHLCRITILFIIFSLSARIIRADDILGCGGFVKSHANLDFSKIEIGLYTKGGSLKERTECAPTNGYYFLPLYEKGEYVLKVHPPAGWSFEPSQVELNVDGTTDPCSTGHDINFAFNGFGITGRVITAGQTQGPSGIAVQLIDQKGEKRDTVTGAGGDFHFTPVIPGKYTLKASHPKWKLEPSQAVVQVKEGNTALPVGVLAVKGYDVRGSVTSFGTPIGGVYVLLYSKEENPKFRIEGCKTALLQGVPDAPICHSITNAAGEFSFGLVPAGEYELLALAKNPGQATISYNIKPERVPFSIGHDSQYIKNAFEVRGFTLVGSVLTAPGGKGIGGVRVLQDGRPVGTTDAAGKFTLPTLQPATYTLTFQHELCEFNPLTIVVNPNGPAGSLTATAARWRVCGAVAPSQPSRRVVVTPNSGAGSSVTPGDDGKWCTYLPPGVYTAKVDVSEAEQRDGLQFYPLSQKLSVGHAPVDGINFSQLKATVTGRVVCKTAADCENLVVTLRPLSPDGAYIGQPITTVAVKGEYTFSEVLPGSVEVSVPSDRLCWAESRLNAAVSSERADLPPFTHTGYVLPLRSTHDIQVEYSSGDTQGVWSVPAGSSEQCVSTGGRYTLTPRGCHTFQPPSATIDVNKEALHPVEFKAVAHETTVRVLSPVPASDVRLRIGSKVVGPLVPLDQPDGQFAFEHTLFMAEAEIAVIQFESSSLLFSPSGPLQVVGRGECQPSALTLRATRGLTLTGKITPPVEGVIITLTSDDIKLTHTTTDTGTYSFGPLDASKHYTVSAEKESYVFHGPDQNGDFAAHKLAEIVVDIMDDADGSPLQGALVSVSGGSYRKTAATGPSGNLRFPALSPAQYYAKPLLKEYRFRPPHHIVHVSEGLTHRVEMRGVRVAWSCIGSLVSLAGAGWAGATVRAVPSAEGSPGDVACTLEEATTELDGSFRIRGLVPNCIYSLQLKPAEGQPLKLAGSTPPTIQVKDNKDIQNVRLIAIEPTQITDTNVLVYTPSIDHYKALRLHLALDDTPHTPIYSTKLDGQGYSQHLNPGLMYVLPRLPADNKTYVLSLTASLSKSLYNYDEQVHYFVSDGKFKHFNFEFLPEVKSSGEEVGQTSFLVLPFLVLCAVAWYARDSLLQWGKTVITNNTAGRGKVGTDNRAAGDVGKKAGLFRKKAQ